MAATIVSVCDKTVSAIVSFPVLKIRGSGFLSSTAHVAIGNDWTQTLTSELFVG